MEYFARHKLITLTLLIQMIALPLLLILTREPQNSQGKAASATTIYFAPSTTINSPQYLQKDEYFSTDVIIEPGANLVQEAQIEIFYDTSKVELIKTSPVSINSDKFPKVAKQPIFESGKIILLLSTNQTKPITEKVKVATIYFKALDEANRSYIYFGDNTKLFGINNATANILQESVPEIISISTASAEPQTPSFSNFRTTRAK